MFFFLLLQLEVWSHFEAIWFLRGGLMSMICDIIISLKPILTQNSIYPNVIWKYKATSAHIWLDCVYIISGSAYCTFIYTEIVYCILFDLFYHFHPFAATLCQFEFLPRGESIKIHLISPANPYSLLWIFNDGGVYAI